MRAQRTLIGFLFALVLAGCARPSDLPAEAPASIPPAAQAPAMAMAPAGTPSATVVPEVDRSCKVAADCEVKNVGNCCGYFPGCVNKNSPTFPDLVAKQCAEQGVAGICGFQEIKACACNEGRCEASDAVSM